MPSKQTIKSRVEGMDALLKKLARLKKVAATRVMRKGVTDGTKVVLKSAKARVPGKKKGKRNGLLKKSLGRKTKTYRNIGVVVGVIGPRKGFAKVIDGKKSDPVKYAHLVEKGRKGVRVKRARVLADGTTVFGKRVKPVAPQPFMRPALDEQKAEITKAIADGAAKQLEKEAKK